MMQTERKTKSDDTLVGNFLSTNVSYYEERFSTLGASGNSLQLINWGATFGGSIWSGARGIWSLFWLTLLGHTMGITMIVYGILSNTLDKSSSNSTSQFVALGLLVFLLSSIFQGSFANWILWKRFQRWKTHIGPDHAFRVNRLITAVFLQISFLVVTFSRYGTPTAPDYLTTFPAPRLLHRTCTKAINDFFDFLIINFETFFDLITVGLRNSLNLLDNILLGIPWPIMFLLILVLAWRAAGLRITIFSLFALAYLGLFGYWEKSMSTLSLVGVSALLCIVLGAPIGIWCAKNQRVYLIVKPALDFMQTMPSFVYLIPAVAFFSIGKPPGVFATVIFAMPPMIRLTVLGIQQVPSDVKEAALAFGASPWKLLLKVELPLAIPSLMTGINQTIMMSLSMVIVASMIGAGGLGYDVLKALRHLNTGEGILAGTAIVFCAMLLDRIIQGQKDGSTKR
tara:strand:- start:1132 stop:2493 length:1362 start_codon:yes stop_codon:yes gene_type:complete